MVYLDKIKQALNYIREQTDFNPEVGIILGTGLGALVDRMDIKFQMDYSDIPYFPISTVESHTGRLIFGLLSGRKVVAMQGRFHYYEGYDMKEVTFPVRVMKLLGIDTLFVSNAAGGVNLDFQISDLMIIEDHIDLTKENPLTGKNMDEFGGRFPDMSEPYDRSLIDKGLNIAQQNGIRCHEGVYVGVSGPNLETRAEYRFIRRIGGDAVGMSTIPEVIVARHMGLRVFAISAITDICDPDHLEVAEISNILTAAAKAELGMTTIIETLIANLAK
ncbi:MAG: purine-nucleoside phosphorylase [Candidatus Endobugula sp.]|jgi:purine-nucleoside phosphorylase